MPANAKIVFLGHPFDVVTRRDESDQGKYAPLSAYSPHLKLISLWQFQVQYAYLLRWNLDEPSELVKALYG
jgi:hypothetical protein